MLNLSSPKNQAFWANHEYEYAIYEPVRRFIDHMRNTLGQCNPDDWRVGITNDPKKRLADHGVNKANQPFCINAKKVETARAVEKFFVENGAHGDRGGGIENSTWVYIFLVNP